MRALRLETFGPPSLLRVVELPPPPAPAGEAVVAVRAAAVNPSDVKNVAGKMAQTTLPRTPGRDYAGVVTVGPPEWMGVAVWGTGGDLGFTRDGAHAERVVVPVASLRRMPARLGFAGAAAAGTPFVTAELGLSRAAPAEGDVVVVVGAAGAVGSAATQLAARRGARVVGVVRTRAQSAIARASGAGDVVVLDDGEALAALDAVSGTRRAAVVFDTTGHWLDGAVQLIARGGRVVVISAPPDGKATFDLRALYRHEGHLIGVDSLALSAVDAAALLEALAPGFASGALTPPRCAERPLDEAPLAYADPGKVVLIP